LFHLLPHYQDLPKLTPYQAIYCDNINLKELSDQFPNWPAGEMQLEKDDGDETKPTGLDLDKFGIVALNLP
jgi:hypothetical protein